MKSHPILFSGDMVRAILEGRKTQTRRLAKPQPFSGNGPWDADLARNIERATNDGATWTFHARHEHADGKGSTTGGCVVKCPYGAPGDELWVRETFNTLSPYWCDILRAGTASPEETEQAREFACDYRADRGDKPYPFKWTPSIHMPRWASRITRKVTDVRVQRLMDASEADIIAEGFTGSAGYQSAMMSAYGDGITYVNPWVWAITFEVKQ